MEFAKWLTNKYLDWQKEQEKKRTVIAFAEYLDVPPASLSDWMNGKYKPKSLENVQKIALKLGNEVYKLLDLERVERDVPWEDLPEEYRLRLESFAKEVSLTLKQTGSDPETPEAKRMVREIAAKYGLQPTETDTTSEE